VADCAGAEGIIVLDVEEGADVGNVFVVSGAAVAGGIVAFGAVGTVASGAAGMTLGAVGCAVTSGVAVVVVLVFDVEPGVAVVTVVSVVLAGGAADGAGSEGAVVDCTVVVVVVVVEAVVGLAFSDFCWQAVTPTAQRPASVASRMCLRIGDIPLKVNRQRL
jgi:hypothetical protein